ncbi:MAG: DNA cytosine methyltransferase, partial [Alphaproteobacteria bacterium]|nr:DNA cytosine methyltransferase [Alphaproteobacteria bacterium]
MKPLIVDLFAGGGGASQAIFNATGRHPDVAVNHSAIALGVHQANHPLTKHLTCDVREVDPVEACTFDGELQPVGLLWASPDCTHFSKARGGKPVQKG